MLDIDLPRAYTVPKLPSRREARYAMTPPTPPQIDAQTAISYIIAAGGNYKLAAVRASKELHNDATAISEASLLSVIAHDPSSLATLSSQVRLLAMLQAVDAFRLTHARYLETLPSLSARDTAHTYISFLNAMAELGKGAALTPTDPYEAILRALPPEVSGAVRTLLSSTTPESQQNPPPPSQPELPNAHPTGGREGEQPPTPEWLEPPLSPSQDGPLP